MNEAPYIDTSGVVTNTWIYLTEEGRELEEIAAEDPDDGTMVLDREEARELRDRFRGTVDELMTAISVLESHFDNL